MAFVRRRVTKTGEISTALMESYRDTDGKSRHRVLANLHGAETLATALGRLAAKRDQLREERAKLQTDRSHAEQFYETVTLETLQGRVWMADSVVTAESNPERNTPYGFAHCLHSLLDGGKLILSYTDSA